MSFNLRGRPWEQQFNDTDGLSCVAKITWARFELSHELYSGVFCTLPGELTCCSQKIRHSRHISFHQHQVQSDGLIRNKPRICMKGRHNLAFLKSLTKGFCSLDLGQGRNKCWWILFYKRHQQLQYQSLLIMSSQYNQRQDFTQPRGFHYLPIIHTLNRFTMTDGRLPWQLS